MRFILASLFGLALLGAAGERNTPGANSAREVLPSAHPEANPDPLSETCRDRIRQAREAAGQSPLIRREPASPERPVAIYAVDRMQDGCSAMVMMGNPDDIQPIPDVEDGAGFRLLPADNRR